ncbi:MAG: SLC13 family permease [Bacteroidia bacterium]|nr:MAG: SLC13 family permease [Bacteroidia bacterium]
MNNRLTKDIFILLAPVLFVFFWIYQPLNATIETNKMMGIVLWMAIWWMTECVHLAVTSLLPIVLLPLAEICSVKEVTREYGDSIIFLFLGGFLISIAIEKWHLHYRIARVILYFTGTSIQGILGGIMVSTFLLSNWISNTATALMMFGVVMALVKSFEESFNKQEHQWFASALLLGMAYAASIGGMATPVGTPPNMYFFKMYPKWMPENFHISFAQWMGYFFPLSVLILIGCYVILQILFLNKIRSQIKINAIKDTFQISKMRYEEKVIAIVFCITIILWLTKDGWNFGFLNIKGWKMLFHHSDYLDDSVVAIGMSVLLFLIPSKQNKGKKILEWNDVKQLKYEILLLFGGGFALAYGFEKSGLIHYLVEQLEFVKALSPFWLVLIISTVVVVISEFASNIASIQLALPVIIAMISHYSLDIQIKLLFPCVLSASVGFMLPIATAPNTIAFGSGYVSLKSFLKAGFWLDIFCIFVISLYCYFVL